MFAALDEAARTNRQFLFITGEAGIGKTVALRSLPPARRHAARDARDMGAVQPHDRARPSRTIR